MKYDELSLLYSPELKSFILEFLDEEKHVMTEQAAMNLADEIYKILSCDE